MRRFTYYLFENFDPDQEANNQSNPRCLLNASAAAPPRKPGEGRCLQCIQW